eukprot:13201488-Heterocapsa_arctica.AAC.1
MSVRVRGCPSEVEKSVRSRECQLAFETVKQKSSMSVTVLDTRFGNWYYWILDWRLGIAESQIVDEVHFDLLFMVFGVRKATR